MNSAAHGRGDDDQRDVDGEDQPGVVGAGGGQHGEADELHGGDADVAAAGVEAERPALQALRVEGVDVGHRRREVAAADAGDGGDREQRAERDARLEHDGGEDAGTSSSAALTIVQLRPPNLATANV